MLPDIESIERATLDAVAPEQIDTLPGWLLPYDRSGLARATSAVPLRHAALDPQALETIAARYQAQGRECQFRIADAPGLGAIHAELCRLGYTARRPVLTQVNKDLDWRPPAGAAEVHLSPSPTEAWKHVHFSDEFDAQDSADRVNAMARGRHALYGWITDASGPVAAGAAVFSQGWVGIHGMRTREHARGRGLAKQLIATFFATAQSLGLQRAFLQVEEENLGARQAYQHCGFETAWRYRYWRKL